MKSILVENKNIKQTVPCYYMPKMFLTDHSLSEFSLDSKLLTGVIISLAKTGEDIVDATNLIQVLGQDTINELLKELKAERGE